MKNIFRFAMIAVLALSMLAGFAPAKAALQSYNSGFQVQNLEGTEASITIHFFDRDGNEVVAGGISDTIAPNSSNTYFPLPDSVAAGFDGSVVIESTTQVAAITNILGTDDGGDSLAFGASYSGFTSGSNTASLPLLMKANYGYNTWFSVQNLGSAATDVMVEYSDGITATVADVQPGAAAKFEQTAEAHADGWVGSAVISADQPVAATALEVGATTLFAYDSFAAGSVAPVMPLVNENNYGYVTGIQVQNVGTISTTVTIDYTPGSGQPGTACSETRTIPAGTSVSFALYVFAYTDPSPVTTDCTMGEQFVGSAVVSANTNAQDVVAIVNQLNGGSNKGAAYNAFDPAAGTERVVFPLIMDRNYNYWTGFNVVNVGSGTVAAASLVCTVTGTDINGDPVTATFNPPSDLGPGEGWNQVNINLLADRFVGSADCVAPAGSMLVGTVNEVNTVSAKDAFLVYEGTNP